MNQKRQPKFFSERGHGHARWEWRKGLRAAQAQEDAPVLENARKAQKVPGQSAAQRREKWGAKMRYSGSREGAKRAAPDGALRTRGVEERVEGAQRRGREKRAAKRQPRKGVVRGELGACTPKMSFLIYETGSVVCCGAVSIDEAKQSGDYLIKQFRNARINVKLSKPVKLQNVVASLELETVPNLKSLAETFENIEYEPEQFPAAIWREPNGVTVLLFKSGKAVCVGARKQEEIKNVMYRLCQ